MGSFRIALSDVDRAEALFTSMPDHLKSFARQGLSVIASLNQAQFATFVELVQLNFLSSSDDDTEEMRQKLSLSERQASAATLVGALAIGLVTSGEDTERSIEVATTAQVVTPETAGLFRSLMEALQPQKQTLSETIQSAELASETLPSFNGLDLTLDLRLGFEGSAIKGAVPVVLAHLRTDVRDARVFFQIQKRDIVGLISQLEKILRQVEEAEKWAIR